MDFTQRSKIGVSNAVLGIGLLFLVITIGITGFTIIEGYKLSDAFYMTVITISTVGFREVHSLSDPGKIFVAFYIIFSLGIFAYVITSFTRFIFEGVFRNYFKDNKVKKRIEKLKGHVIVCGYGRNGRQAIADLIDHDEQVVVIDRDEAVISQIREETNLLYVHGDSSKDETMAEAQIKSAKALITAMPLDADNLFVVLTAREMNSNLKIISRAAYETSDIKLKRAGATNVIMPDRIGGQRMAKLVAQPDVVEFIEYIMLQRSKDISLEEVSCEHIADFFVDKSIRELDVRNASGANIVGLRKEDGHYIINPTPEERLSSKDKLFVLGTEEQVDKLKDIIRQNLS